ncbi:unnamed protein product [Rangifer tarandus platyrhynchus]|uniref:Uncharacterized protein n=2 Tax=Rangifer tarandus platyrhynchus TaxID=3082113 RepID=A0AC59YGU3_RANTA|nr:unnamed protein product [Rangifer tarandus platyrhynchus]
MPIKFAIIFTRASAISLWSEMNKSAPEERPNPPNSQAPQFEGQSLKFTYPRPTPSRGTCGPPGFLTHCSLPWVDSRGRGCVASHSRMGKEVQRDCEISCERAQRQAVNPGLVSVLMLTRHTTTAPQFWHHTLGVEPSLLKVDVRVGL